MKLQEQLQNDMNVALKSGDKIALETLRMVRAQLKNVTIAKGKELADQDVIEVLAKESKRRKESQELYRQGGRNDLADKEAKEQAVISHYLPQPLTEEELSKLVTEAVQKFGAEGPGDMGKVMGVLMPQVKGRADGKIVQEMVKKSLG